MKEFFNSLFSKVSKGNKDQQNLGPDAKIDSQTQDDEVTVGTKIKVVAALLVVGFAGYIAYWIQEPVEVRTDIFGTTMQSDSQISDAPQADSQGMTQMAGETQQVSIQNFAFNPATLNVDPGTTVVWTNNDQVPHNVVGDSFTSPTLNPGDTFSYTFNDEGTFSYKCTFHPQMTGTIIVGNPPDASLTQSQIQAGTTSSEQTSAMPVQNQENVMASSQSQISVTPEQLYVSRASAPADLHGAALQSLSGSLSNVGNIAASASGNDSLSQEQTTVNPNNPVQPPSVAPTPKKLASSGPEDYIYLGMFSVTLYLNRGALLKSKKKKNKK